MEDAKKLNIIIPTYNEKDNIYSLIVEIAEVLSTVNIIPTVTIIDDNSPDGTGEIIEKNIPKLKKQYPFLSIHLIKREGKLGLGTAYIRGFKDALNYEADYIMEMDADFSHQPKYLPIFIEAAKENDVVIGSRYVRGGKVENWGIFRRFISLGGSIYARTILGMKVQDMTGGFNLFKSEVLRSIHLDDIKSNGYSFQLEMKYRVSKKGFKIKEIPIVFPDRRAGKSKMSKKIFLEAIKMVWKIRLDKSIEEKY